MEGRRRSNSISNLPSLEPKPKMALSSSSNGENKKSDQDLVLWISNKLKTKLKLARISKAYDRSVALYSSLPFYLPLSPFSFFLFLFLTIWGNSIISPNRFSFFLSSFLPSFLFLADNPFSGSFHQIFTVKWESKIFRR